VTPGLKDRPQAPRRPGAAYRLASRTGLASAAPSPARLTGLPAGLALQAPRRHRRGLPACQPDWPRPRPLRRARFAQWPVPWPAPSPPLGAFRGRKGGSFRARRSGRRWLLAGEKPPANSNLLRFAPLLWGGSTPSAPGPRRDTRGTKARPPGAGTGPQQGPAARKK
jgi:hypothetical protein